MGVQPDSVAKRAETDLVLRTKFDRMKALVNAFCPAVNGAFWKCVNQLRERKKTWKNCPSATLRISYTAVMSGVAM